MLLLLLFTKIFTAINFNSLNHTFNFNKIKTLSLLEFKVKTSFSALSVIKFSAMMMSLAVTVDDFWTLMMAMFLCSFFLLIFLKFKFFNMQKICSMDGTISSMLEWRSINWYEAFLFDMNAFIVVIFMPLKSLS